MRQAFWALHLPKRAQVVTSFHQTMNPQTHTFGHRSHVNHAGMAVQRLSQQQPSRNGRGRRVLAAPLNDEQFLAQSLALVAACTLRRTRK